MSSSNRFYDYAPSRFPGKAVAYIRGDNPDPEYRTLRGEFLHNWTVPHFDVGGFDEVTGERTANGVLTDFLNSDLTWLIVHERVKDILTGLNVGPKNVQWLDVCIHHEGKESVRQYFVANILDVRTNAVNEDRSKYTSSGPNRSLAVPVLRKQAVRGADIFRIAEWDTRVYFSSRIKRALDRAQVTGVEWGSSRVDG